MVKKPQMRVDRPLRPSLLQVRNGISLPQVETEANESDTLIRTDFEQLTKLQDFLISLMLIAPIDAVSATGWDPTDWDRRLEDLKAMKSSHFRCGNRPNGRPNDGLWTVFRRFCEIYTCPIPRGSPILCGR